MCKYWNLMLLIPRFISRIWLALAEALSTLMVSDNTWPGESVEVSLHGF
jgi:hypothetical protein